MSEYKNLSWEPYTIFKQSRLFINKKIIKYEELETAHLLPKGWKIWDNYHGYYNVATGKKSKTKPKFGFGGVMEVTGLPSLNDLIRIEAFISSIILEQFIELNDNNEEYIKENFSDFHNFWQEETGQEEEILPWIMLEQMELFVKITQDILQIMKNELSDNNIENWEKVSIFLKEKLENKIKEKVKVIEDNEKLLTIGEQIIKTFLTLEVKEKNIIIGMIKGLVEIISYCIFIPDGCRLSIESISLIAPYDRDIHHISINRDIINKNYCRIFLPSVVSKNNDEVITKPRVIK